MRKVLKVGDSHSLTTTITDEMVRGFAKLTGDENPIHLDDVYAAKTRFEKRIAHGMLVAATLSRVAGMYVPGPGTVVLAQELKYKAPCFIGDTVTTEARIVNMRADKPIIKVEYTIKNQKGELLTDGSAVLYYDPVD